MDTQHQQRAYIGKGRKSGLYAYELLDTIKNESKGHIKSLALDKELKVSFVPIHSKQRIL